MNLFQLGSFTLSSKRSSDWKIECDALTDEDIATLANLISKLAGPFSSVEGIPRGGLRLCECLREHTCEYDIAPHLIVDDVLTTGRSITQVRDSRLKNWPWGGIPKQMVGAVIFARGKCPSWIKPVFQLYEDLW